METWDAFDARERGGLEEVLHLAVTHIAKKSKKEEGLIWDDLVQTALGVEQKGPLKCGRCGAGLIELMQTGPFSVKCNVCGRETVFTTTIDIAPSEEEMLSALSELIASEAPKMVVPEPKPTPVEARTPALISGSGADKLAAQRAAVGNPLIDASEDATLPYPEEETHPTDDPPSL